MRAHNAKQFVSISINVISRYIAKEIYIALFISYCISNISNDNEWEFFGGKKKKNNKTKWKEETSGDEKKKKKSRRISKNVCFD